MAVIALDLGGTKLAGAIVDTAGRILHKTLKPLNGRKGRRVGDLLCRQAEELLGWSGSREMEIQALGVSVPGISRVDTGRVWAPNIPGCNNIMTMRFKYYGRCFYDIRIVINNGYFCHVNFLFFLIDNKSLQS